MLDDGYDVGDHFTWGTIGRDADYRSSGDFKFVDSGGLAVDELVLVRERRSTQRTHLVALLRVLSVEKVELLGVAARYTPLYEMVERFDGSATLDQLRACNPSIASMPHFHKNAAGYMLRSFTALTADELDELLRAVRASIK